jgi:hypothetical protein
MMDFRESFYDAVTDGQSAFADMLRSLCNDMMRAQIPDSPELWAKLTPGYNPGCKRVIISDEYYPAIADEKTTLETGAIKRVTETGVELENGEVREHDMLVLATGFRTVEFLSPIQITGTQGRSLAEEWAGGAHALYGTVVPSLPNFGMYVPPSPLFSFPSPSLLYSNLSWVYRYQTLTVKSQVLRPQHKPRPQLHHPNDRIPIPLPLHPRLRRPHSPRPKPPLRPDAHALPHRLLQRPDPIHPPKQQFRRSELRVVVQE